MCGSEIVNTAVLRCKLLQRGLFDPLQVELSRSENRDLFHLKETVGRRKPQVREPLLLEFIQDLDGGLVDCRVQHNQSLAAGNIGNRSDSQLDLGLF